MNHKRCAIQNVPDDRWTLSDVAIVAVVFGAWRYVGAHYDGALWRAGTNVYLGFFFLGAIILVVGPYLVVRIRCGREAMRPWGKKGDVLKDAFLGGAASAFFVGLYMMYKATYHWLRGYPLVDSDAMLSHFFSHLRAYEVVLFCAGIIPLSTVGEELTYRWFAQLPLTRDLGRIGGIVVPATLFVVAHWQPMSLSLPIFGAGILLGSLSAWRRSLVAPVACHLFINLVAIVAAFPY